MDRLELYLDRVCRGVGGPRALRLHIRQELREHLRDAAAEHEAAGMPAEQALERALADFGGPDQLRSELTATHGERVLGVMIDTAIQWKEKTMRARWLWTTWTYLATIGVVVLELLFLCFCNVFFVPKLKKLQYEGWLNAEGEPVLARLHSFLNGLQWVGEYFVLILLLLGAVWGMFEWRVRSENKTFMRLSALGTGALGLAVAVCFMAAALIMPFILGLPSSQIARPFAVDTAVSIEMSVAALEQARAKKDWGAMHEEASRAEKATARLEFGPALHALGARGGPPWTPELQALQAKAKAALAEAQRAIADQNADRLALALKKFHEAFDPIAQAAKKPVK